MDNPAQTSRGSVGTSGLMLLPGLHAMNSCGSLPCVSARQVEWIPPRFPFSPDIPHLSSTQSLRRTEVCASQTVTIPHGSPSEHRRRSLARSAQAPANEKHNGGSRPGAVGWTESQHPGGFDAGHSSLLRA